jgi:hypothetical protein
MIAALSLALEYDHRGECRQLVRSACAGDSAADDQNVGGIGMIGAQNVRARIRIRRFVVRESSFAARRTFGNFSRPVESCKSYHSGNRRREECLNLAATTTARNV